MAPPFSTRKPSRGNSFSRCSRGCLHPQPDSFARPSISALLPSAVIRCNAELCPSGDRQQCSALSFYHPMPLNVPQNAKTIRLGKGIDCKYSIRDDGAWLVSVRGWDCFPVAIPDAFEGIPVTGIDKWGPWASGASPGILPHRPLFIQSEKAVFPDASFPVSFFPIA